MDYGLYMVNMWIIYGSSKPFTNEELNASEIKKQRGFYRCLF